MKSLQTLIKLQKMLVDEQRQHLSTLQDHLERIEQIITQLEINKAREQVAAQDNEARTTYGAYLQQMIGQGRVLEKERQTAAMAVKIAQYKLAELFEEQKRYEIAEAQRIEKANSEERRRETIELDEVGSVAYERRRGD